MTLEEKLARFRQKADEMNAKNDELRVALEERPDDRQALVQALASFDEKTEALLGRRAALKEDFEHVREIIGILTSPDEEPDTEE